MIKKVFADLEKITLNKYDVKINARCINKMVPIRRTTT